MSDLSTTLENTLSVLSQELARVSTMAKENPEHFQKNFSDFLRHFDTALDRYFNHHQDSQTYRTLLDFVDNLQAHCKSKSLEPLAHKLISMKGRLCFRLAEIAEDASLKDPSQRHLAYLFYHLSKHEFDKNAAHHTYQDKADHQMVMRMVEDRGRGLQYDNRFDFKKSLATIHHIYPVLKKTPLKNEFESTDAKILSRVGLQGTGSRAKGVHGMTAEGAATNVKKPTRG